MAKEIINLEKSALQALDFIIEPGKSSVAKLAK